MQLKNIITFFYALMAAFLLSSIVASRSDSIKESNDTSVYAENYQCLESEIDISYCNSILGANEPEFIYQFVAKTASQIFDFYWFKLVIGFIISFPMVWVVLRLSPGILVPSVMLFSDFRFWEYVSNVLRHGLALSIFLLGFFFLTELRDSKLRYLRFASIFTHIGAVFYLLSPIKKIHWLAIVIMLMLTSLLVVNSDFWLPELMALIGGGDKLNFYYVNNTTYDLQIPIHYLVIILLSSVFYGKSNNSPFIASVNILIILLLFSMIFGLIGLSYRVTSLMLPFVIICAVHQISCFSASFSNNRNIAFVFISIIYITVFLLAFFRNLDAFFVHLI